jgi:hypothetical protein
MLTTGLLAVLLLVSCAPASEPMQTEAPAQSEAVETEPPTLPAPTPTTVVQAEAAPTGAAPTQAQPAIVPTETPQAVATSRGPDLEATDPSTVSLASGELHFVEFFRFT